MTSSTAQGIDTFGDAVNEFVHESTGAHQPSEHFSLRTGCKPETKKAQNLVTVHQNVRGRSRDDDITELLAEVETIEWDFMSINATMRTKKSEF